MLLYHGSNTDIKIIDLAMCRPYKDFGRGFYLTVMKEQAEKMAQRVARIYGGFTPSMRTLLITPLCITRRSVLPP